MTKDQKTIEFLAAMCADSPEFAECVVLSLGAIYVSSYTDNPARDLHDFAQLARKHGAKTDKQHKGRVFLR
jgi:hypothetical protein